ncbi:alanine dehydrogenase [Sulfurimonas sp.]|uniref:alanine dehydrogenase n=1 Tax=Sulfurimonas sp. TaxID=2022749 RepID=UPI0039E5FAB3
MIIGIPKEVKTDEFRVAATPLNIAQLIKDGHSVVVEKSAGKGSGFSDDLYMQAGAKIVDNASAVYSQATLIVKVKEPQKSEYELLNEKHTLFCYLHLAPLKDLTATLVEKGLCAIAYETVAYGDELPLLKPMSEIAGKMAPTVAAHHLSRYQGGEGILISGASGVEAANILVIGAGNAGAGATEIAYGLGANVTVINRSSPKLENLKQLFPNIHTEIYTPTTLEELIQSADVVIGTVLIHGGDSTPKLISKKMLQQMKKGSVLVDITIDQGGISESSRPTTHTNPIFVDEGVIHYCVANMPGAYPKTATIALTNSTFEYVKKLANLGTLQALRNDASLRKGVNVYKNSLTNAAVAKVFGLTYKEIEPLLDSED